MNQDNRHNDEIRPRISEAKFRRMQELYDLEQNSKGEVGKKRFMTEGRHLVLGCMHVPFHNKRMLDSVVRLLEDYEDEFSGLHLIGDFMDLNTFSSHDRGKFPAIKGLTYKQEIKESNEVLDIILNTQFQKVFKDMSYIYGNHEDRYWRFHKDMENAKRPLPSPTEALNLIERGFAVHEKWDRDYVMLGNHLQLHHGTYFNVHCAKNHLDKLRSSNMFAHTHRIQHYIEGMEGSYNIGFGGDKESPAFGYASRAMRSQWQNGAAVVTLDKDGNYFVEQLTFINNHFVYGGKIY